MTKTDGIRYELWDMQPYGNDSLLKPIIVTSTNDTDIADIRATAAAQAHIRDMGYMGPSLVLYRQDHTIAWEAR